MWMGWGLNLGSLAPEIKQEKEGIREAWRREKNPMRMTSFAQCFEENFEFCLLPCPWKMSIYLYSGSRAERGGRVPAWCSVTPPQPRPLGFLLCSALPGSVICLNMGLLAWVNPAHPSEQRCPIEMGAAYATVSFLLAHLKNVERKKKSPNKSVIAFFFHILLFKLVFYF